MARLGLGAQGAGVRWTTLIWVILISWPPGSSSMESTWHGPRMKRNGDDIRTQDHIYEFGGQLDLIVVMDISQSVGPGAFQIEIKDFMEHLIRTAIIINPDYTRLAAITFASEVSTVIDSISGGSFTGCELFSPDGPWEQVTFIGGASGSDIMTALYSARQIFSIGRVARPGVKQALLILSDAESFDENSQIYSGHLKEEGVMVYGVGVGFYLRMDSLKNLTSEPWSIYCQTYGAWMETLRLGNVRHKDGEDLWLVTDLCPVCGEGASCYCSVFHDFPPTCYCEAGLQPDQQGRCQECGLDHYKSAFGNHSCSSCPASTPDHDVRQLCAAAPMSVGVQAAIAVSTLVLLIVCCVIALLLFRLRSRANQKATQCDFPSTIYTQTLASGPTATAACDIVNDVIRSQTQSVATSAGLYQRSVSNADSGISSMVATTSSNPRVAQIRAGLDGDSDSEDYANKDIIDKIRHQYESSKSRNGEARPGKRSKHNNTFNMFRRWGKHNKKSIGSSARGRRRVRAIISMFERDAGGKTPTRYSDGRDRSLPEPYCHVEPTSSDLGGHYTPLDIAISPSSTGPSFDNHGYLSPLPMGTNPDPMQMTRSLAYITRPLQAVNWDGDYQSVSASSSRSSGPYIEILENPAV